MAKGKLRRLPKQVWRSIKRHRKRRAREAAKAAKAAKLATARGAKAGTVRPSAEVPTRLEVLRVRLHQSMAEADAEPRTWGARLRVNVQRATAQADPDDREAWAARQRVSRADAAELVELQDRLGRRRRDRRHSFTCGAHTPPAQFASMADLNQHLTEDHREATLHKRGTVSQAPVVKPKPPPRRRQPDGPTRIDPIPPPPGATADTRAPEPKRPRKSRAEKPNGPHSKDEAAKLKADLVLVKFWADKIKTEAMNIMGAQSAASSLGDIGSMRITTVSQIMAAGTALEGLALAMEEAVTGFQQNMRTSEQAPVDEEVIRALSPAIDGAQQVAKASVAFLAAFNDKYGPDIAKAKAGDRMDNTALTN